MIFQRITNKTKITNLRVVFYKNEFYCSLIVGKGSTLFTDFIFKDNMLSYECEDYLSTDKRVLIKIDRKNIIIINEAKYCIIYILNN